MGETPVILMGKMPMLLETPYGVTTNAPDADTQRQGMWVLSVLRISGVRAGVRKGLKRDGTVI